MQLVKLEKYIKRNNCKIIIIIIIIIPSQTVSSCECIVCAVTDIRVGMNIQQAG
jgi:hypothetical protein